MKLTIHDIADMLVGIAKPWGKNLKIFTQSYWGKNSEYWLHVYVSPDKEIIEKLLKLQWWNFEESELVEIIPILQSADYERLFKLY